MKKLMTLGLVAIGLLMIQDVSAEAAKKSRSTASTKTEAGKKSVKAGAKIKTSSATTSQRVIDVFGVNQCEWDCGKANKSCAGAGKLCSSECRSCLAGLGFKVVLSSSPGGGTRR